MWDETGEWFTLRLKPDEAEAKPEATRLSYTPEAEAKPCTYTAYAGTEGIGLMHRFTNIAYAKGPNASHTWKIMI